MDNIAVKNSMYHLHTLNDEIRTITKLFSISKQPEILLQNFSGSGLYKWMVAKYIEKVKATLADISAESPTFQIYFELTLPDLGLVSILESGCGLFDTDDKLYAMESTIISPAPECIYQNHDLATNRKLITQVLEGSNFPMFVINKNHEVMYWNYHCEKLTGVKANDIIGTNRHWSLFYKVKRPILCDILLEENPEPKIKERYGSRVKRSHIFEDTWEGEDFFPNLMNGLWLYFNVKPIRDEKGEIICAVETIQDISDHKKTQLHIRESEDRLRYILENANDVIYTHDMNGNFTMVNPYGLKLFGYDLSSFKKITIKEIIHKDDLTKAMNMIRKKLEGENKTGPYELLTQNRDGQQIWMEVNTRLVARGNKPIEIIGIARNITERKKAERLFSALNQATHAMMQSLDEKQIFEKIATVLNELEYNSFIYKFNKDKTHAYLAYSGFSDNRLAKVQSILNIDLQKYLLSVEKVPLLRESLEKRKSFFETEIKEIAKQVAPKTLHGLLPQVLKIFKLKRYISSPLIIDDKVIGIFVVFADDLVENDVPTINVFANQIAAAWKNAQLYQQVQTELQERIEIDRQLELSLHEKDVLLKEIHHRVKNNLQIILSLLNLQSRNITDQFILDAFQIAKNRIQSMAIVHEQLYKSNNFANINFKDYINSLVQHLKNSYEITGNIEMAIDVTDVEMNIDNAIPYGLLINELVTNSLKHAFPNGRKGNIGIKLYAEPDGTRVLIVQDNGIGIVHPADDLEHHSKLGMNISRVLIKQLGGTFDIQNEKGTTVICHFPVAK